MKLQREQEIRERPGQGGSNLTQFSMLEKIENMLNAPKKFAEPTKQWERALDEDYKKIKKYKAL